jgi:Photoprotection regulator fluorescence recovery protein
MEPIAQHKLEETWTPTEKKLARKAFDKAFERQCAAITEEVRRMLQSSTTPSEIFRIQEYLTEQRRIVDRVYDYRYSRLLDVFGRLLSDGWLREGDLDGLQPEKIAKIKHGASFFCRGKFLASVP